MHIPWDDARIFLAVAETGSLSGAARSLRVTQPTISRRLAALESQLGESLFERAIDGATLTSYGERLVEPARRMAEWAAELDRAAEQADSAVRGTVRITAAPGLAFDLLAPFAAWLRTRLPEIRLEVASSVRYVDLARREADLALRFERNDQPELTTLRSVEFDVLPFAAPSYAERVRKVSRPADIDWIAWAPPFEEISPNPQLARLIPGFRPVFASDDYLVQFRAAQAGVGAILLGDMPHPFETTGMLVPLRLAMPRVKSSLHLVAAKSAIAIPRVRAVADLLAREVLDRKPKNQRSRTR